MMWTEAEARKSACCGPPAAASAMLQLAAAMARKTDVGDIIVHCRASACMGWRWAPANQELVTVPDGRLAIATFTKQRQGAPLGFCGCAGPLTTGQQP